jgi:hypothetical protein
MDIKLKKATVAPFREKLEKTKVHCICILNGESIESKIFKADLFI